MAAAGDDGRDLSGVARAGFGPADAAPPAELPDLARRRAFLEAHVVIHTHIPKTGGSAFAAGLAAIFGGVHSMDLRLRRRIALEALPQDERDRLSFVTGHVRYGVHRLFSRRPLYLACVRDPVARALSYLRFVAASPGHPDHARIAGLEPGEALDRLAAARAGILADGQARVLVGRPRGWIRADEAIARAEDAYLLVLPQSRIGRTLTVLRNALGLPRLPAPRLNRGTGPALSAEPALASRIRAANPADCALVAHVEARFEARLAAAHDLIAGAALARP